MKNSGVQHRILFQNSYHENTYPGFFTGAIVCGCLCATKKPNPNSKDGKG